MSVTLEQLLQSRDKRAQHQRDLLGENPGKSLLCLTVQLPGSEKRNGMSLAIAKAGVEAIREAFKPEFEELLDLETGYEGYFLVSLEALEAKRRTCRLEDTHPLGRLMDIDVLVSTASAGPTAEENYFSGRYRKNQFSSAISNLTHADASIANPTHADAVGREDIGLEPRRCLLCGNEVRYCMRAKSHTQGELLAKIEEMVNSYLKL